ncbi:U11/U12 small nuclear ribonucleoprotein 25 kDa protein-like [Culicoides brevitarsis]|uniref:U11/U12 small nuclear ribonucleoprotein 25 kDa protein-like n=1 Tax=Culicoides brevitarsis TaxID=469753 RepID=UPI00307CABA5
MEELSKLTKKRLKHLLKDDTYLSDIPPDITSGECKNLIALAYGQSISLLLDRGPTNPKMKIIVPAGEKTTVEHVKKAIRTQFTLNHSRTGDAGRKIIRWKYIWKTYWLKFEGSPLDDDRKTLEDLGIGHGSELKFMKRRRIKNSDKKKK